MNHRDRRCLLEQKRQEEETNLQQWAAEEQILEGGEQLTFELRIRKVELVVGRVLDEGVNPAPRTQLPEDEWKPSQEGFYHTTFNLTEEEWSLLEDLSWNGYQFSFLKMLREHKNGPLYTSEVTEQGIEWHKQFVRHFNKVLNSINSVHPYRANRANYHLEQAAWGSGAYAIKRWEWCRERGK